MGNNHLKKGLISDQLKKTKELNYLNKDVSKFPQWGVAGNHVNIFISLQHLQYTFQCFSEWSKNEMQIFWAFNTKVHDFTWQLALEQGGKGGEKVGFGLTQIDCNKFPNPEFREKLDPQTKFFEMRASDKIRLHGFRSGPVFFICWLDRNHDLT